MTNRLSTSQSPYLKQHQHNPVFWQPWDEQALNQAKNENKLILVSIGYSTCHWCHVMEKESFESEEVAKVMNDRFVCIKVDREENPEIDQIYMTAVQLMGNRGGWPLNCICLPDGRPIYGGTYFPKNEWISVLSQIHDFWLEKPNLAIEFAEKLANGIKNSERLPIQIEQFSFQKSDLQLVVEKWKNSFDRTWGGLGHAPKFPMPNDLIFWLEYSFYNQDAEADTHLEKTLRFMASGGIFDQVEGGFCRYSVDERWHIPHFEKMLYDNAQLISLYASAYKINPLPKYKRTIENTINWCISDLKGDNGGYFCALDADSEGVEGKYYTFTKEEFDSILGEDAQLFSEHFQVTAEGNWEEEKTNVLYTLPDSDEIALEVGFEGEEWENLLKKAQEKLKNHRKSRIRPDRDEKQLASWNSLLISGFVNAYKALGKDLYLQEAIAIQKFIEEHLEQKDGSLLRQPIFGESKTLGVLEDYAHYIHALLDLYEISFDESYLYKANELTDYVIDHFLDEDETFFYFTHQDAPVLITRKIEVLDNVIPSSNSVMMKNLLKIYTIFEKPIYREIVYRAMRSVLPELKKYPSSYSNWASLLQSLIVGTQEIVLSGKDTLNWIEELYKYQTPYQFIFWGHEKSEVPILKNRLSLEKKAYICENNSCSLPIENKEDLVLLLNKVTKNFIN